jgi:hypothetical protein
LPDFIAFCNLGMKTTPKENGPVRFGRPFNHAIKSSSSLGVAREAGDSVSG